MKSAFLTSSLAAVVGLMLASGAQGAVFTNGSFETITAGPVDITPLTSGIGIVTLPAGNTQITGWVVTPVNIDVVSTIYWGVFDGQNCIDLSGFNPGGIQQTFDTVPGETYGVTFEMNGNPDGPPDPKTLDVNVNGGSSLYAGVYTPIRPLAVTTANWQLQGFTFVADSTSATISFSSAGADTSYGPVIDNVTVTPFETGSIPEPASLGLLGLGTLALVRRRKA